MQDYEHFVESIKEFEDSLKASSWKTSLNQDTNSPRSFHLRFENNDFIGEVTGWESSSTFYQALACLDSGEYIFEKDGCKISPERLQELRERVRR